jgi:uncharacterized membrane protein YdbT with pleckstrin-like domain
MSEEVVFFRGSPSLIVKAGTFALGFVLIAGFIALGVLVNPFIAIGAGVVILWLLGIVAYIRTQVFEVTSQRLKWTRGILTKRTDEMELYRVLDVSLVEPFLLRIFGAGNIEITSADTSTPRLTLPAVKGARELREKLRTAIEARRDQKGVRVTEFDSGQGAAGAAGNPAT